MNQTADIKIINAHIIDGTGAPMVMGDIALKDGRITALGKVGDIAADHVIDATGLVVTPGFID